MRGLAIAALGLVVLASGQVVTSKAAEAPSRPAIVRAAVVQEARLVTKCRIVKVKRKTPKGTKLVPVKRCRKVEVR